MAYKSQNYERHGAAGLDFSTVRGVRVARSLGEEATAQIVKIRDGVLAKACMNQRKIYLRPSNTYSVTLVGRKFVCAQLPSNNTVEDDLNLAYEMYENMPETIHEPLSEVATDGLVLLGSPNCTTRPLAIRLESPALTNENRVAKSILRRTVGRPLIGDERFIPHITIAYVKFDRRSRLRRNYNLPSNVLLRELMFS